MDSSLFLKKDGRNFLDFALRYLHQEKYQHQKDAEINLAELNEMIDLAMDKASGNYHNLIEIVSSIIEMDKDSEALDVVRNYKPSK